ncbi:filamentous hemagglutinin N-terminal domain-containing protein [Sphaerospermopsis aphanizomenoides BCCUSP55]|uniref:two-partner secretion domain-containing protein n=1 Tax=Sphaerospermopsis aphanizomenoides TaxID=459663 RepID=UPI00190904CE|nr:filamentous hemagglutinin N-terminal domain-containing protein [Sphaerospermopsis aphanizomenoides]MBK1989628.1 filamentous hemagglutinin N-terminal domain-containing protein [Sphaerospermopsis aphanizomenoides BCCUSP55]
MNNSRNFAYGKPGLFVAKKTIIPIAVVSILGSHPCLAQITADTTLGNQNSRVITDVNIKGNQADLIEGGIQRGSNLYHSFLEFNVNNGQRVYFANPTGVDNILSRVTGSNRSEIFGTLGVNGAANLFLLNPKGIIFGPNAQLDIQGSFLATTANSFVFPDGSEFSATNPQAPPLLTMSVPVGVQFGSQPTASITNEGDLVTGKDLTLNAGNLDLQGTLQAGGNLKLQAQDSLKVRDSASKAFIAAAGGNLLAQGNQKVDIYALNHPDSGFYSAGNMVLKSQNTIGGDAHFWAGGNFRIENLNGDLGNLFSPDDPVIRATGDVSFDSYTGVSLHILAGGSVNIDGYVNITGADDTDNSLTETVTLSDGKTKIDIDGSETPTLDIRAGVDANYIDTPNFTPNFPIGFYPQNPTTTNTPTNANINIQGGIYNISGYQSNSGKILITNQYHPNGLAGDITTGLISTFGDVVVDSRGAITTNGGIDTTINDYVKYNRTGGSIKLFANQNILIKGDLLSNVNGSLEGNGGDIYLNSRNGDIDINADIISQSPNGNGGNISIKSHNGNINIKIKNNNADVISTSTEGNDDNIPFNSNGYVDIISTSTSTSTEGSAGNILIQALDDISISENTKIESSAKNTSNFSGTIQINTSGKIAITNSNIISQGSGGFISIGSYDEVSKPESIVIENSEINTDSNASGNASNSLQFAGAILINASDEVSILNGSKMSSEGNDGYINIFTDSLSLNQNSEINTSNTGSEKAGYIIINANDQISILNGSKISSEGNDGYINIFTDSLSLNQNSEINTSNTGSGFAGYIKINASDEVYILNGSKIFSQGVFGYINIFTGSLSLTNRAQINSSLTGKGNQVGTISIEADNIFLQGDLTLKDTDEKQTGIFTQIREKGELLSSNGKGNIRIETNKLIMTDRGRLSADTYGKGDAGDITVTAQQVELKNQGGIVSLARDNVDNNSGNIELNSRTVSITDDAFISVSNRGKGNAGNVTINATDSVLLERKGFIASSVRNTGTGKGGNININTNLLTVTDQGKIEAQNEGQGDGGSIAIKTENLLLRRQSKITATAGSTTNPGNGGSITINAKDGFVIAVPSENSDIIANAFGGNGGKIEINANRILGFQNQANLSSAQLKAIENNGTSDISASSDVGQNGQVSLNTLSIDPTQGLLQLPTNLVDTSRLIAQSCGSNSNVAKGKSEFVITGRGGLPPSPDETLKPGAILPEWVVNNTGSSGNNSVNMPERNLKQLSANNSDTLVEAVGMVRSANGDIVFTAQPTTATGLQSGLSTQVCDLVQGNLRQ